MWIEAGFDPDSFWHQTPDTFSLAMQGVRKRLEREAELYISTAWHIGVFAAAAQAGKIKPLRHYLRKPGVAQKPNEMIAALREFQARGAKMKITRIRRSP